MKMITVKQEQLNKSLCHKDICVKDTAWTLVSAFVTTTVIELSQHKISSKKKKERLKMRIKFD